VASEGVESELQMVKMHTNKTAMMDNLAIRYLIVRSQPNFVVWPVSSISLFFARGRLASGYLQLVFSFSHMRPDSIISLFAPKVKCSLFGIGKGFAGVAHSTLAYHTKAEDFSVGNVQLHAFSGCVVEMGMRADCSPRASLFRLSVRSTGVPTERRSVGKFDMPIV
jgi:hypothetical protein